MNIQLAIEKLIAFENLSENEMKAVMMDIMAGKTTDSQIGGFLTALRMKGETVEEITAGAKVMRALAKKVKTSSKDYLIDTCGTGGDSFGLFNISTASAFVAAAAGAKVAKHGNRSISSKSGSADLLEIAGVNLAASTELISECIDKIGIGFMFAPMHHQAMKYAIGARKELAVRTIFNMLGPLTNPAQTPNQLIGVYSKELVEPIAKVLKALGSKHVMVVHSKDGLDEISIADDTYVAELKDNVISNYTINPRDFHISIGELSKIKVSNKQESLDIIKEAFDGKDGVAKDIISLNAGAAIYVSGICENLKDAITRAQSILTNGDAKIKLEEYILASNNKI